MTCTQDSCLFVENGAQNNIGINETFHQDIGLAVPNHTDSTTSTLVLVITVDVKRLNEAHFLSFLYSVAGGGVTRTDDSYTLAVTALLQKAGHII
jgi:hypothetical protein